MIWEYIKCKMLKNPHKKIMEGNVSMSYEEVVIYVENYAKKLTKPSYAILCHSEMHTALALLSCLVAGVTAIPLSYRYGNAHWRRIVEAINPTCIISDSNESLDILDIDIGIYKDIEERPLLIMCTSGTTGIPKGAMISDENLFTNIIDIESYFDISSEDKILITRPLYHCAVLSGEFLISLVKGLDIVFKTGNFEPLKVLDLIEKQKITVMCGTPTIFYLLERFLKKGTINLKSTAISGECMRREGARRIRKILPNTKIYHVYGLTEASPRVLWLPPKYFDEFSEYVGIPLPSVQIKIVDENGDDVSCNEEGELCVRGKSVMMGYYEQSSMTEKVLKDGWLHTGDIAVMNESGFVSIRSRKDDMIIKAGINIFPQEIENILKTDERVEEVLAYGVTDTILGQKIALKIKGRFSNKDEIIGLCHEKLPAYEQPSIVEIVEEIPKNGSGKMIRRNIDE